MTLTSRFSSLRRALGPVAACAVVGAVAASCQDRPICPVLPIATSTVSERLATSYIDKIDILLAVDNSYSMHDKQVLLALAVPDLLQGLVNPPCLDEKRVPIEPGPAGPLEPCPKGSARSFDPILDIHIGVITSNLGSHGADSCTKPTENDEGHLVFRPELGQPNVLPTYQGLGFLAWDPAQKLAPPGEADLEGDTAADQDGTALAPVLKDMILGTGDEGCGYESQLESWYRFLADPEPYATLEVDEGWKAQPVGIDEELLAQRKAFLRPDSLLALFILTDENDCSVREYGQYNAVLKRQNEDGSPFFMPRARTECATDPNDECCFSCAQTGPKDDSGAPLCPADPTCKDENGQVAHLDGFEDDIQLRCWDQKRRFGIDFLYPIERYTRALTEPTVPGRSGEDAPNPIFSDLDPEDANSRVRTPGMVVVTAIAGVPWQDIARDPKDLKKGFKTADELSAADASGRTAWDIVLGDPAKGIPPADPLMIESKDPRGGVHPITGEPGATAGTPLANSINGHDPQYPYLLQYACIFDLPEPLDCAVPGNCLDPDDSPVYDPPYDQEPTLQVRAGARPGPRILSLLKSLGDQGVVASACPAQTSDPGAADFGYRPAMAAALRTLEPQIKGGCLPRTLEADENGQVSCILVEARAKGPAGACCDPAEARVALSEDKSAALEVIAQDTAVVERGYDCFCEIPQLEGKGPGEPLYVCQNDASDDPALASGDAVNGYCYVDAGATPPVGNPEIVAACPDTEKRILRFVGKGKPGPNALVFIACSSSPQQSAEECSSR
jgi:hypothetical protein